MRSFISTAQEELDRYRSLQAIAEKKAAFRHSGKLVQRRNSDGSVRFYLQTNEIDEEGKRHTRTRPFRKDEADLCVDLLAHQAAKKCLPQLRAFTRALQKTISAYRPLDVQSLSRLIPRGHNIEEFLQYAEIHNAGSDLKIQWKELVPAGDSYRPEELRHEFRNHKVRTRIEYMICSRLEMYDLTFMYEVTLTINGIDYHPDFAILRPDGSIVFWEHCGLMHKSNYVNMHFSKLRAYWDAGLRQGINLICTYEGDGIREITTEEIDRIIRTFILTSPTSGV